MKSYKSYVTKVFRIGFPVIDRKPSESTVHYYTTRFMDVLA